MKIKIAATKYLKEKQSKHSKVKGIKYDKLETQQYMKSQLFTNDEVNLLFAIRSRFIDCKMNFKNKYDKNNLNCSVCEEEEETQEHLLNCKILNEKLKIIENSQENVQYEDIFADHKKQKVVTSKFEKLLNIRRLLLENNQPNLSNPSGLLKFSYDIQPCIVNYSSGN